MPHCFFLTQKYQLSQNMIETESIWIFFTLPSKKISSNSVCNRMPYAIFQKSVKE